MGIQEMSLNDINNFPYNWKEELTYLSPQTVVDRAVQAYYNPAHFEMNGGSYALSGGAHDAGVGSVAATAINPSYDDNTSATAMLSHNINAHVCSTPVFYLNIKKLPAMTGSVIEG